MPKMQLIITVEDNGSLTVSGPLQQEIICLGLLEMAKVEVRKWNIENQLKVAKPSLGDIASFARK